MRLYDGDALWERIANFEPMEMTFTINDADLDKLNDVIKDINVRECPWFEVQDKHGNKAKYFREPQWIPVTERLPDESNFYMVTNEYDEVEIIWFSHKDDYDIDKSEWRETDDKIIAWKKVPEPFKEEGEQSETD